MDDKFVGFTAGIFLAFIIFISYIIGWGVGVKQICQETHMPEECLKYLRTNNYAN